MAVASAASGVSPVRMCACMLREAADCGTARGTTPSSVSMHDIRFYTADNVIPSPRAAPRPGAAQLARCGGRRALRAEKSSAEASRDLTRAMEASLSSRTKLPARGGG